jgi:hypothetical protein
MHAEAAGDGVGGLPGPRPFITSSTGTNMPDWPSPAAAAAGAGVLRVVTRQAKSAWPARIRRLKSASFSAWLPSSARWGAAGCAVRGLGHRDAGLAHLAFQHLEDVKSAAERTTALTPPSPRSPTASMNRAAGGPVRVPSAPPFARRRSRRVLAGEFGEVLAGLGALLHCSAWPGPGPPAPPTRSPAQPPGCARGSAR